MTSDDRYVRSELASHESDDLVILDAVFPRHVYPVVYEASLGAASVVVRREVVSSDLLLFCPFRLVSRERCDRERRTGRRKPGTERSRSRGGCGSSSRVGRVLETRERVATRPRRRSRTFPKRKNYWGLILARVVIT